MPPTALADALTDWIALRSQEPGPLLVPVNKSGRLGTRRLTDQAVLVILAKRAASAGVPAFSPHDLRRSFISDLLDRGADISTAQHLAGYANVQTTARYDRRGEAAKRKAAELLHVPYFRGRRGESPVIEETNGAVYPMKCTVVPAVRVYRIAE
jgi:integrase